MTDKLGPHYSPLSSISESQVPVYAPQTLENRVQQIALGVIAYLQRVLTAIVTTITGSRVPPALPETAKTTRVASVLLESIPVARSLPVEADDFTPRTTQTLAHELIREIQENHRYLHDTNSELKDAETNLSLAIGSSRARSKDTEKDSSGSNQARQFIAIYDHYNEFVKSTEGAEKEMALETLKKLDEALPLFLIDSPVARREFLWNQIQNMKEGESRIIPFHAASLDEGGHAMLLELTRELDGTFTLMLFNTGEGLSKHTMSPDGKFYPYTISGIPLSKLDEKFCKDILKDGGSVQLRRLGISYRTLERLMPPHEYTLFQATIDIEKVIDPSAYPLVPPSKTHEEMVSFLKSPENAVIRATLKQQYRHFESLPKDLQDALNTPLPPSLQQRYTPYFDQGQVGNCTYKCLSTYMRRSLPIYQKFKVFKLNRELQKLEEISGPSPSAKTKKVIEDAKVEIAHSEERLGKATTSARPSYTSYYTHIESLCGEGKYSEALALVEKTKEFSKTLGLESLLIILKRLGSTEDTPFLLELARLLSEFEEFEIAAEVFGKIPDSSGKVKAFDQLCEKAVEVLRDKGRFEEAVAWAEKITDVDTRDWTLLELVNHVVFTDRDKARLIADKISNEEDREAANRTIVTREKFS